MTYLLLMNSKYHQKEKKSEISFLDVGGSFQNFWGTYRIKICCIYTGHLPLSGYGLIPTIEFYHTTYLFSMEVCTHPIDRIKLGREEEEAGKEES